MPALAGIGAFLASGTAAAAVAGALLKIGLSLALSKLQQAMLKKKLARNGGIATETTIAGETAPEAFTIGRYATAGHMVCPEMSHGKNNRYLTYVIEIASVPGVTVNRLIVNNLYLEIQETTHATFGNNVWGHGHGGKLWIKTYDGTQVAADPYLLSIYGSQASRPWTSEMIGNGISYAILTFRYDEDLYRSMPQVRFEVDGLPLYDPRQDSTVGGSGSQEWGDPSTWTTTNNPMVMVYNIKRGITLPGGRVWGLGLAAADLPLATWFAAMNACDASVTTGAGSEAAYRAGFEVFVNEEPADVIDQLLAACSGEIVDVGGIWKSQAGPPDLPVYSFSDGDVLISAQEDFNPFPGLEATFNGAHARYPDPSTLWLVKDAPPRYDSTLEAVDLGKQLIADLELPAVPYKLQVQRLMKAYVEDERRFRRHELSLPVEGALLEPLDQVAWTSSQNGYSAKLFEISEVVLNCRSLAVRVALRERDPEDYDWSVEDEIEVPDGVPDYVVPDAPLVTGFGVTGTSITDDAAADRRPALLLSWTADDLFENEGIAWEIRVEATGTIVSTGSSADVAAGTIVISQGLLADTLYEARVRPVAVVAADWTSWASATTPNVLLDTADLGDGSVTRPILEDGAASDQSSVLVPGETGPLTTLNYDVFTYSQPPPDRGKPFALGMWFDFKASAANPVTVSIQIQTEIYGVLGSWTTLGSWTASTSSYVPCSLTGDQVGGPDVVNWRLRVTSTGAGALNSRIRDLVFNAVAVIK